MLWVGRSKGRDGTRETREKKIQTRQSTGKESGKEKTGETIRNATKVVLKEMETKKDQLAQCHLTMTGHDWREERKPESLKESG